jgi:transcriptional regulator GlxA family with amidase domain
MKPHSCQNAARGMLPHEPRCRCAADIVLGDPTASHAIETLARAVGTSARTLSRLFASEMSFKSWCQRARIAAAIERLSMQPNVSVKQLAAELGYASFPAFFPRVPAGDRQDADGFCGGESDTQTVVTRESG